MKRTYEFKNDKYNIIGYTISNNEESEKYKTDVIFGTKDNTKWIININGKEIAFYNTGNNIINSKNVIIIEDELNIITDCDFFKIDLKTYKCIFHLELDSFDGVICSLIKYNNGFLIYMDFSLLYIENNKIKWKHDSSELIIKVNVLDNNIIEIEELTAMNNINNYYLDKEGKVIKH